MRERTEGIFNFANFFLRNWPVDTSYLILFSEPLLVVLCIESLQAHHRGGDAARDSWTGRHAAVIERALSFILTMAASSASAAGAAAAPDVDLLDRFFGFDPKSWLEDGTQCPCDVHRSDDS